MSLRCAARHHSRAALCAAVTWLWGGSACAPTRPTPRGALDTEFAQLLDRTGNPAPAESSGALDWRDARARLDGLRRAARGGGARTLRVRLTLREPHTGQVLEARGAIAISPVAQSADEPRVLASPTGGALRMILLGPGGTTALDLWTRGDRFRFAIPALDLLKRGDASTPRAALRGLPVDFLRWWLLRPATGTLLWHERVGGTDEFILRDGEALVDLRVSDRGLVGARRATWAKTPSQRPRLLDEEVVIADRVGCGSVRYAQASTGLLVSVTCEGEERERAPDPRAFVDPDAMGDEGEAAGERR